MLLLSRKQGEKVVVPGLGIVVTILELRSNQVRIGITAPPSVTIHRQEVHQRLQEKAAAPTSFTP